MDPKDSHQRPPASAEQQTRFSGTNCYGLPVQRPTESPNASDVNNVKHGCIPFHHCSRCAASLCLWFVKHDAVCFDGSPRPCVWSLQCNLTNFLYFVFRGDNNV